MMRSYSSRLSRLIDEFVESLCIGPEEMVPVGMINLAVVGGSEMEDPKNRSERRGIR